MENNCVLIGLDTSISSTGVSIYLNGELASYFSLNQTNKKPIIIFCNYGFINNINLPV